MMAWFVNQRSEGCLAGGAMTQTVLMGSIFFLVFAAYYTLQGYASILLSAELASNALSTLYAVFTLSCFGAPGIVNAYGAKRALGLGVFGYAAFSAAALVFAVVGDAGWSRALVVGGGALNGLGAAVLWTAQGRLMLDIAAADTREVGAHFAVFWALFNASAIAGGLGTFFYLSDASGGNAALFVAFTAFIMAGGLATSWLEDAKDACDYEARFSEARKTLRLFSTKKAATLAPLFWYSGFNQPYQLNGFGDRAFHPRIVGLQLAVFYAAAVLAGVCAGRTLDARGRPPRAGAVRGLEIFAATATPAFVLAAYVERALTIPVGFADPPLDWLAPTLAFALWGFSDSYVQAYCYWVIDKLYAHSGPETSRAVGLYKFVQSAGWCAGYALLPPRRCPYAAQLALVAASFVFGTLLALFELPPAPSSSLDDASLLAASSSSSSAVPPTLPARGEEGDLPECGVVSQRAARGEDVTSSWR
ncbi:hypothetical protein CTAYLR_003236 [Chrysophaeum taylorii]|uniref:UNC93-like protein n=1 Tax=Chrysophaeum taylorii TaxID=2483200 RepID=A0AAD7UCM7_9STRA|nr:hypothetical protein CTAYLR_003236 [Chrysophaeum taylorii]